MAQALSEAIEGYEVEHPEHPENATENFTIAFRNLLAKRWVMKKPDVIGWVSELEADGYLSVNEVMASVFACEFRNIDRVDRLLAAVESRRNSVLREIERRRATFAQLLRSEIQKVEDAEFKVIESRAIPQTNKTNKNAA
jgi:hypothetical protein